MIQFHKDIIAVHKMNQEFLIGSLKELERDYNVIGYGRFTKHGQSAVLVNNNDYEVTKELAVWYLGTPKEGMMKRVFLTTAEGHTIEEEEYPIAAGKVKVTLPPTSAIILKCCKKKGKGFLQFR